MVRVLDREDPVCVRRKVRWIDHRSGQLLCRRPVAGCQHIHGVDGDNVVVPDRSQRGQRRCAQCGLTETPGREQQRQRDIRIGITCRVSIDCLAIPERCEWSTPTQLEIAGGPSPHGVERGLVTHPNCAEHRVALPFRRRDAASGRVRYPAIWLDEDLLVSGPSRVEHSSKPLRGLPGRGGLRH